MPRGRVGVATRANWETISEPDPYATLVSIHSLRLHLDVLTLTYLRAAAESALLDAMRGRAQCSVSS